MNILYRIVLPLLFCSTFLSAFGQDEEHHCATVPLSESDKNALEILMKEAIQAAANNPSAKISNAGLTCVPIKIHDITDGAGGGAVNLDKLNKDIANLNYHFFDAGIEFYICGAINTYDDAAYYNFDNANEATLKSTYPMATNAFNMYLVKSIIYNSGAAAGYAYYPGNALTSTFSIIDKDGLASIHSGTIVHEFGHHFNLHHTFEGTEDGNSDPNAEHVPRTGTNSNCTAKGDLLCDTEADPRGTAPSCVYASGATDIHGNVYTPPVDNIMSYYSSACKELFTPGQSSRIAAALTLRLGHTNYSLNCAPASVPVVTNLSAVMNGYNVNLTWTDNASNEIGYLIERSSISSTSGFKPLKQGAVAENISTFSDNSVASKTTYWYRIKASNGDCNTYSSVTEITTPLIYCIPTYLSSCSNAIISNFTLTGNTTINNTSTCSSPSFTIYSNEVAEVTAGTSYSFSVTKSMTSSRYVQVYADFNRDGDFDDADEKILPDNTVVPSFTYTGTIAVPSTAMNGNTALRILLRDQTTISSACMTSMSFGETEEYTINIVGGVDPPLPTSVNNTISDKLAFRLFPNPSTGIINVEFNENHSGLATCKVIDCTGKTVQQNELDYKSGKNTFTLSTTGLNEGIFVVQLIYEGKTISEKFVLKP